MRTMIARLARPRWLIVALVAGAGTFGFTQSGYGDEADVNLTISCNSDGTYTCGRGCTTAEKDKGWCCPTSEMN